MGNLFGILGGDDTTQGGILGGGQTQPGWANGLGLFGAALKDAAASVQGRDSNSVAQFQQFQRQNQLRQAYALAANGDASQRPQAYAAILAAGGDPSALQHAQAQQALPQLMANMQPQQTFNDNPVAVTPAMNAIGPGVDASRAAALQTNAGPATSMQPSTLSGALQRTGSPELTAEMAPRLIEQQAQIAAKSVRQANAQEKIAGGYKPSDPVFIDAYGNLSSEVKPQAAVDQTANAPLTKYQTAQLANAAAEHGETARHNKAEENIALNPLGLGIGTPPKTDAAGNPLTGSDFIKTLPPAMASTVKAIGDGRMAPVSGFALAKPQGMAIMAAVNQYNPDYDATTIHERQTARNSFANKNGNTVRSLNVAISHLDALGDLSDALGNGNIQAFNQLGQAYAQQTGSAAPTNFDAAKHIVGDEITKAIIGTGGSQADRDKAQAAIDRANSPAQLKGAIQTYQTLLGGQLNGLRQQYSSTTKLKDFNDFLSPETQLTLGNMTRRGPVTPNPSALPQKQSPGGQTRTGVKFQILGQ